MADHDVIDTGWLVVIKGHKTVVDTNQLAIVAILFIFTLHLSPTSTNWKSSTELQPDSVLLTFQDYPVLLLYANCRSTCLKVRAKLLMMYKIVMNDLVSVPRDHARAEESNQFRGDK